jgi:NAD(P)-dependent dehydrogenase (short-subunit alcohol dehydrogenase family)/acyl carrier protein
LIFAGDAAEGRLLLAEWRLRGGDGVIVTRGGGFRRRAADHFEVHPRRADDYTALAEALAEREILPARVVHLWGLSEPATAGEDVYLSPDTTLGLDRMLAALLGRPGRPALDVVAVVRGVAAPLDADMLEPRNAGVLALAMVAAQEHPALRFRVLDTDRVEVDRRFAGVLLDEQAYAEGELLTAYRGPSRFVRRFERLPAALTAPRESRLQSGGVYVLLGGLGHIGLGLAEYLAQRYGARLVLTGRQGAPPRAEWPRLIADPACPADMRRRLERLLAIESHAGGLLVLASDVTAESDLQAVRKRAHATFGQIDGLMLLAGAMGSSETAAPACDEAALAAAMAAKAGGTAAAVRVFDEEPLAFGLIFSSISSLLGGIGHFAYAASNQYADAVIQAQAEPGPTPWMSVNWDLWQGTAIDGPAATDRLNNRAISGAEGAMALERLLQLPPIPQVVVSTHDLQARLRTWASASLSAEDETPTAAAYERPEISTPFAPPETELEIHIAGIWQKLLGVGQVGRNDDFFELGGHSLLGVKLIGGLRNDFAVDVSLQEAFRSPTVADMASLVDERLTCFVEALAAEDARAILEELDT